MSSLSGFKSPTISIYRSVAAGVKSDGTIEVWGNIQFHQYVYPPPAISNVVSVALAEYAGLALLSDGSLSTWGNAPSGYYDGELNPPPGIGPVIQIAAGENHFVALLDDGTVLCWGNDQFGKSSPSSGLSNVVSVAAGQVSTMAIKADGTLVYWGQGGEEPPPLSGVTAIGMNPRSPYYVVAYGDRKIYNGTRNTSVTDLSTDSTTDGLTITSVIENGIARFDDGSVRSWDNPDRADWDAPASLDNVVSLSGAGTGSLALSADGGIHTWEYGSNISGYPASFDPMIPGIPPPPVGQIIAIAEASISLAGDHTPLYDGAISITPDITGAFTGAHNPPAVGNISAAAKISIALSGFYDPTTRGVIGVAVSPSVLARGFQDFVSQISPLSAQKIYRLEITDNAQHTDLVVPISSWQATSQAEGRSSYLQCVIPAANDIIEDISDRQNGNLVLSEGYRFGDGTLQSAEIVRAKFDNFRYDRGPARFTVTVSGLSTEQELQGSATRHLKGVRSISNAGGKLRVRCNIDLFLRPGMTVVVGPDRFKASYINYFVNQSDSFCEVGER